MLDYVVHVGLGQWFVSFGEIAIKFSFYTPNKKKKLFTRVRHLIQRDDIYKKIQMLHLSNFE